MKLKTYEIECDFCEEVTRITMLTRTDVDPEHCPCCGEYVGAVFVDAEEDSDDL